MTKTDAGYYVFDDPDTDGQDRAFLHNAQGLRVGGKIVLPSGREIPPPPEDKMWEVSGSGIIHVTKDGRRG